MMKRTKAIILRHNGGQFANQMWNFISIYAYARKTGRECRNYSFFEYDRFFDIPVGSHYFRMFFWNYKFLLSFLPEKSVKTLFRFKYKVVSALMLKIHPKCSIFSGNAFADDGPFFLPPTKENKKVLPDCATIYFDGWLFRNPEGMKKYRKEILEYFAPKEKIRESVRDFIVPIRKKYRHIIGIHIRQNDYIGFKDGKYFVPQSRARKIIDEYIETSKIKASETCFVICSDGKIDGKLFSGLDFIIPDKSPIEEFFILTSCDIILGADSTFGALAAWFGNIPHVIFKKEKIDWEYYKDERNYFENKYFVGNVGETPSS
jgi:hypothetical protein